MPAATLLAPRRPAPAVPAPAPLSRRQGLLCLAVPLAAFAVVLLLFGVRYEVNDDALISCIAAGAYGADTVHLCYVNILVGLLLKPFYLAAQWINWYVVFSVAGLLACYVLLCRMAVRRLGTAAGLAAWGVFFLFAGFDALQAFQYTKNAGIFAVTGALLLAAHLGGSRRGPVAGAGALLLAGACLRWESFLAVAAMAAPLLALRLARLPAARRRALARVLCAAALCALAWCANEAAYRLDPAWNAWRQYNAVRTEISDHRLQYIAPEQAADYGLSDADYAMLQSWDYDDTALYPLETLEALAAALPHRTLKNALRETLYHLPDWLLCTTPGWLLCGAALVWLLFAPKSRGSALAFGATLAVFLAGVWALFYGGRTPWRVEYLMLAPCALLLAALCFEGVAGGEAPGPQAAVLLPPRLAAAVLACCLAACFAQYQSLFFTMRQYRIDNAADTPKEQAIQTLLADKSRLYVVSTAMEDDFAGKNVWRTRPAGAFDHITFLGGWAAQSPLYAAPLEAAGLPAAQPLLDAVYAEEAYLVDFAGLPDKLAVLSEHLGLEVTATEVDCCLWWTVYRLDAA